MILNLNRIQNMHNELMTMLKSLICINVCLLSITMLEYIITNILHDQTHIYTNILKSVPKKICVSRDALL